MTLKFNLLGSVVVIVVLQINLSSGRSVPIGSDKYEDQYDKLLPKVKRQASRNVIVAIESNDVGLEFTVNADSFTDKPSEEEKPMEDQAKDQAKDQQAESKPKKYILEKGVKDFFDTFKDEEAWQKYCKMNGVEEEWRRFYRYYYKNKYPDRPEPQIDYHKPGSQPAPVNKSQRNG